jgi:hypothetical protein
MKNSQPNGHLISQTLEKWDKTNWQKIFAQQIHKTFKWKLDYRIRINNTQNPQLLSWLSCSHSILMVEWVPYFRSIVTILWSGNQYYNQNAQILNGEKTTHAQGIWVQTFSVYSNMAIITSKLLPQKYNVKKTSIQMFISICTFRTLLFTCFFSHSCLDIYFVNASWNITKKHTRTLKKWNKTISRKFVAH